MGIVVTRSVHLKVVVTEAVKQQWIQEIESALQQVELHLQRLEWQGRRYLAEVQKKDVRQVGSARAQFEEEKQKQEALKAELLRRKGEVERADLGSELLRATWESPVTLEVGDCVAEKLAPVEIVVRDDVIVAIRAGDRPQ